MIGFKPAGENTMKGREWGNTTKAKLYAGISRDTNYFVFGFKPAGENTMQGREQGNTNKLKIYDFKKTQERAKEKSYEIARLSLKEIFDLIKDGGRDASFQMINVLLYTAGAFLLYNSVQIFFVENPDYAKSIICFVVAIPIYYILQGRKF